MTDESKLIFEAYNSMRQPQLTIEQIRQLKWTGKEQDKVNHHMVQSFVLNDANKLSDRLEAFAISDKALGGTFKGPRGYTITQLNEYLEALDAPIIRNGDEIEGEG